MLKRNIFFRTFILVISSILLAACGGGTTDSAGGSGGTTTATTINTTTVEALNPSSSNWNDYVNANGDPCDAATDTTCTNGGLQRVIYVANQTDCTGVTASDNLGVFDWSCEVSGGQARMVSSAFNAGKGITDLIDFSNGTWKEISITIDNNGTIFTSVAAAWWDNPIVKNSNSSNIGNLITEGEINIVTTENSYTTYTVAADKVTLLIEPGVTLSGVTILSTSFAWVEGAIDATLGDVGVSLNTTDFSTLNNVTVSNATYGVALQWSSHNTLRNINSSQNSRGVYLHDSSSDNMLIDIIVDSNISEGVYLYQNCDNNTLTNVMATNNVTGVFISHSDNTTLTNINVTDNTNNAVNLFYSSHNKFSGDLTVGPTVANCTESGGTDPGLENGTCLNQGTSDANLIIVP